MKKVAILGLKRIGDAVYTLPVIEATHSQMDAKIDVITESQVEGLYLNSPFVNVVYSYSKSEFWNNALKQLKLGDYDICVVFHNALKYALLPFLAGIPVRIGYKKELRSFLLTEKLALPEKVVHRVEHNARLGDLLKVESRGILPRIYFSEEETFSEKPLLTSMNLQKDKFVVFIVGSIAETRRWFPVNFAEVAVALIREYDMDVCILGGPEDFSIGEEVLREFKGDVSRIHNFAGKTSLRETMRLMNGSKLVVTNDTGPLHVASAIGVPVVTWFGAANEKEIAPPSPLTTILNAHVHCSPCVKEVCPLQTLECLHKITPVMVMSACKEIVLDKN